MISTKELLDAKILVVDDSPDNVDLLLAMLEQEGYTNVMSTTLPQEVISLHSKHRFDLILLDIQMPEMDGFDVMAGLRELEHDAWLPVLAITAQPAYKHKALEAGAKDFISKPFDFVEVLQRIHNMLEVRLLYTQAMKTSEMMHRLALHDALTGLPNRRLLEDRISKATERARRNKTNVVMMYIDLDGFKQVNDTWGHDFGDELLKLVAQRLIDTARREDTVARLGGDEFMLVLQDVARTEDIHIPAKKLIEAIAAPYFIKDREIIVTTSMGISFFPEHSVSVDALVSLADKALYEAKRQGKNRYHLAQHIAANNTCLTSAPSHVSSLTGAS